MEKVEQKQQKKKIEFIMTGFGAFSSHATNPTSVLIENIMKNKNEFIIPELYNIGPCEVVYVAIQDCEDFYDRTLKYIENHKIHDPETLFIIIHCGLNSGSPVFNLETIGYNCANFSIPDNRNNQFCNKQIVTKYPVEHHFRTMIPAIPLNNYLEKQGFKVKLSDDPGRYICNYIYYLSLFHGFKHDIPTLFIHFPTFENIDEKTQASFAKALLNHIASEYDK